MYEELPFLDVRKLQIVTHCSTKSVCTRFSISLIPHLVFVSSCLIIAVSSDIFEVGVQGMLMCK